MRIFIIALATLIACSAVAQDSAGPSWPLAVRLSSYGDYQDAAWAHLQELGVHYVFLNAPAPDEVPATMETMKQHGLVALVLRGSADLSKDTFVDELAPQLATCEAMDVHYMFLSAKRGDASEEEAYARLRAAGDVAKAHKVVIALETHPDLGTNGEVQLETMRAIDHPNVRVNFDTANITYYNENTTALDELRKSAAFVGTVEFKDHRGGLENWDFPVLGGGIVDFPGVVALLREHEYQGPVTLEFEGTKGVTLNKEQTLQAIADSVAYARSLGCFE